MIYSAAFNLAHINASGPLGQLGTLTYDAVGADPPGVVDLADLVGESVEDDAVASQTFWHHSALITDISTIGQEPGAPPRYLHHSRQPLRAVLQDALQVAADDTHVAVTLSPTTGLYTIYNTVGGTTFTLAFSHAAGARLFGFATLTRSAANSHTSDCVPTYTVLSSQPLTTPKTSKPTPNYEPGDIATRAAGDDARGYGVSRYASPLMRAWTQEFETKERTFRLSATTAAPWTFQHLFEHCRTLYPFYVSLGGFAAGELSYAPEVFEFTKQGAVWAMRDGRHPGGCNDRQFHIPFDCIVAGKLDTLTEPV